MFDLAPWFILLLNLACIIHVIRRNREIWWILVILIFPFLGALIYFFFEILPDLQRGELRHDVAEVTEKLKTADQRIAACKRDLEAGPTIEKKLALADAYAAAERWEEAVNAYEECTRGPFGDDAFILYGLAAARFQLGEYDLARRHLDTIDATPVRDKLQERQLLRARITEKQGDFATALNQYEQLLDTFQGEEARYRYALLLKVTGREADAQAVFREIVEGARQHSRIYRKQNRPWLVQAQRELK